MPIDGLAILSEGWAFAPQAGTPHDVEIEDVVHTLETDE